MKPAAQPPQLGQIVLEGLRQAAVRDLAPGAEVHSAHFASVALDQLDLEDAQVDTVKVDAMTADRAMLSGAAFTEVVLDGLNIPVVDAARTRWSDVSLSGRMGAFTAYESFFRRVHFVNCALSFVNLRGSELRDVAFTDCTIEELDLGGSTCRRVRLSRTRIGTLDVRQASLVDVDLRGAELEVITGIDHLRGATVSSDQVLRMAPLLARQLGLITADEPEH